METIKNVTVEIKFGILVINIIESFPGTAVAHLCLAPTNQSRGFLSVRATLTGLHR